MARRRILPLLLTPALALAGLAVAQAPAQAAAPTNDTLGGAEIISGESGSVTGTTADAGIASEPAEDDPSLTRSVWYRFTNLDDIGVQFWIDTDPAAGWAIGAYYKDYQGNLQLIGDDFEAPGWAFPGDNHPVDAYQSLFYTDYSHDPTTPAVQGYWLRVSSTASAPGPFTLHWNEAGGPSVTTAIATVDRDAGVFSLQISTTCEYLDGTGAAPTGGGYYKLFTDGVPTGDVRYPKPTDDAVTIGNLTLLPGSHQYTARYYYGYAYDYCARSQATVPVVDAQPTTTTLGATRHGQDVTFTGVVSPSPPAGGSVQVRPVPTGDSIAGLLLQGGDGGSRTVPCVAPGKYHWFGDFESPFAAFASSQSAPVSMTLPKYTPTLALKAPKRAKPGSRPTVTFEAATCAGAAKGKVRFLLGKRVLATKTLRKGKASFKLPKLAKRPAKVEVTVRYLGSGTTKPGSAARSIKVTRR